MTCLSDGRGLSKSHVHVKMHFCRTLSTAMEGVQIPYLQRHYRFYHWNVWMNLLERNQFLCIINEQYPATVDGRLRCIVYVSLTRVNTNNGTNNVHCSAAAVPNSCMYIIYKLNPQGKFIIYRFSVVNVLKLRSNTQVDLFGDMRTCTGRDFELWVIDAFSWNPSRHSRTLQLVK